ncbi:hypothetical protein Patl1_04392 [Pistacia atlantica]|uniref:Uncharacterized protein n=1 Tax=Pistacia atlantica TaxID=434234 RepID=A0ACC1BW50_9ROSI|nr:hypothetical protein Patl1_04392 [Pistacia atlantica]
MASNNQNRPPLYNNITKPSASSNKKCNGDEVSNVSWDKEENFGEKMVGTANNGRLRQAFSVDVQALLNEKMKYKNKYNYKERCENMMEYIKRLRLCIRWFQELEGDYAFELERLRNELELNEQKCAELELAKTNKEEELNLIIVELRKNFASLEEKLAKEESDKLAAVDSLAREKETRANIERSHASLSEDLGKVQEELQSANQRILSVSDMYKLLQEYNSSLQHYNTKLQKDIDAAHENIKRGEKEKAAIVENLSTLRGQYKSLQEQLSSCKVSFYSWMNHILLLSLGMMIYRIVSQDEAMKQKDALVHEVACLKVELQQMLDFFYRQDVCHKVTRIRILSDQLAAAENKLQMSDLSALETKTEFEGQRKLISELQNRLEDAECKLIEGEKLRKKLHNTILELKGNIRVFCRVRPFLPDDSCSTEGRVISYPTSTEVLGRGIDIMQNGQKHAFTFDRVFMPDAPQEDVFVEISQLVQSALDGYKVILSGSKIYSYPLVNL